MDKQQAYAMIAEAVEVLEEEGMNVETASVEEMPVGGGIAQLFGGKKMTTNKGIIVLDDWESPEQEQSEDPDNPDDEEEERELELQDGTELTVQ
jgi:hypothetical protein